MNLWPFSKLIAIPLSAAAVFAGATLLRTGDGATSGAFGTGRLLQRTALTRTWGGAHSSRGHLVAAEPERILLPDELRRARRVQRSGLGIEPMTAQEILPSLDPLRKDSDIEVRVALIALARMGAEEALPTIDSLTRDQRLGVVARIADARIRAMHIASRQAGSDAHASAVVTAFLSILNLTPDQINQAVDADNQKPDYARAETLERQALQAIADMVYRDPTGAFARAPVLKALRFSDYPASLKLQLAPMTEAQRLKKIVDDLSLVPHGHVSDPWEITLAAEYGKDAGDAVDVKLKEMDTHRDRYTAGAYQALFSIIWSAQDSAHASVWRRYLKDPNPGIRNSARGGADPVVIPGY